MGEPRPRERGEWPLPEFEYLADPTAALAALRDTVESELVRGRRITSCRVRSIRNRSYADAKSHPKSSVMAVYELSLEPDPQAADDEPGPNTEPEVAHLKVTTLYVKAFLGGRSKGRAHRDAGLTSVLPDMDAYAWVFPGDPAIPGLAEVADPARVLSSLPPKARSNLDGNPVAVDVTDLRYKPEDRCTLRVTLSLDSGASGSLIAKVFSSRRRAEDLYEIGTSLWNRSQTSDSRFVVPEPLGVDERTGALWLTDLPGRSPRRQDLDEEAVNRIARALASFHRTGIVPAPSRSTLDLVQQTEGKALALSQQFPSLEPDLNRLMSHVRGSRGDLRGDPKANVHGAFRLRQLLLGGDGGDDVGILDFDSLAIGDPHEDVMDILLDLDPQLRLGSGDDDTWSRLFLSAYEDELGECVDRERLRFHLPIQLLKRAYWLRHQASRQSEVAASLFERVQHACSSTTDLE